ncbi:unannotated protein [freshwater metagenome]|uniref:Unannotated protein n=1 Tax=freshwater metagenome TaxID=449393 RepID=A0A6J7LZX6_9ZZZZ
MFGLPARASFSGRGLALESAATRPTVPWNVLTGVGTAQGGCAQAAPANILPRTWRRVIFIEPFPIL